MEKHLADMTLAELTREEGIPCSCGKTHRCQLRYFRAEKGAVRFVPDALRSRGRKRPMVVIGSAPPDYFPASLPVPVPAMKTYHNMYLEQTAQNESKVDENKTTFDEEDGRGSKGGEDAEKEEDKTGDDGENESLGNANDRGKYQKETEGEHAGKKIFELDRNGDLGLNPEHLSVTNMKGMVFAVIMLMFLLGALTFVIGTKDRKNNNYF